MPTPTQTHFCEAHESRCVVQCSSGNNTLFPNLIYMRLSTRIYGESLSNTTFVLYHPHKNVTSFIREAVSQSLTQGSGKVYCPAQKILKQRIHTHQRFIPTKTHHPSNARLTHSQFLLRPRDPYPREGGGKEGGVPR